MRGESRKVIFLVVFSMMASVSLASGFEANSAVKVENRIKLSGMEKIGKVRADNTYGIYRTNNYGTEGDEVPQTDGAIRDSVITGDGVAVATDIKGSTTTTTGGEISKPPDTGEKPPTGGTTELPKEERNKLKAALMPLFYLSFDYGSYIINLTPQFRSIEPKSPVMKYDSKPLAMQDALIVGDYRDGFQKTAYGNIEVGLGAQVNFWFTHTTTGVLSWVWGYVGVFPEIGKESESVRYTNTLSKAQEMGGRRSVPKSADDLDRWDAGDSITYIGRGGLIFSAGAGIGPIGVGVAKLANGLWETYVEKVGTEKAYVKITNAKLSTLSMFTNITLLTLTRDHFKYADDGFSFLFDLTTEDGRKAYEDVIRGNVLASEEFVKNKPRNLVERAPVVKVETFRTVSTGKVASKSMMIPIIWDKKYSKGMVSSFTTSDLYIDRNTARVHYGIYTDNTDSSFWFKHRAKDFMFTGAKYTVQNWDTKARMQSVFGTYSYAFRYEKSNGDRLRTGIHELIKKTGLDTLMVKIPDQDLGYTGIEFNVNFDEENTVRLMAAAQRMTEDNFINLATDQIDDYFTGQGDPYNYCVIDHGICLHKVRVHTWNAARKMYFALREMNKYMSSDEKAFAAAYGEFGQGMAENLFTFKAAMGLAGPGVDVSYLIEGTYISMYFREWIIDSHGRWIPAVKTANYKGLPFNPATRHSRVRGLVLGNNPSVTVPHNIETVAF
ncbi:MAG: hypothetical protein ACXVCY_09035 [Pseudobdellovibrionaceae bacterium]